MSTHNRKTQETLLKVIFGEMILVVVLLIALAITLIISGCQKNETPDNDTETFAPITSNNETIAPEITYEVKTYTVQSGDNYWSISVDFYDTGLYYKALARYNNMKTTDVLHIGKTLSIPDLRDPEFIALMDTIQNENAENIEAWNEKMAGTTVKAGPATSYRYGQRSNPAVDITVPELDEIMKNYTGKVNTSNFTKLGSYKITGYTPACEHCCENTDGTGAAGVSMICGYSVAAPENIPFGTTLYIEGYGFYVVEDRGYLGTSTIDIACPTHDACYAITNTNINVYIVPNN